MSPAVRDAGVITIPDLLPLRGTRLGTRGMKCGIERNNWLVAMCYDGCSQMMLRTLLILAFLAQQFMLPAAGALASSQCPAVSTPGVGACCSGADRSAKGTADTSGMAAGCTCPQALCACDGSGAPEPLAPDRTQRSVDQLVPMLALPTATNSAPSLPEQMTSVYEPVVAASHHRSRAILCIWRT